MGDYDHERLAAAVDPAELPPRPDRSVWHYGPLLPLAPDLAVPTPLTSFGWSPLYRAPATEARLGQRRIWMKDDGGCPQRRSRTGPRRWWWPGRWPRATERWPSLRPATPPRPWRRWPRAPGCRPVIFVPAATPEGKLAMCLGHGATVFAVDGSYDDAVRLCAGRMRRIRLGDRSTGINPWTREGKQTAAFEIAEQLGRVRANRLGRSGRPTWWWYPWVTATSWPGSTRVSPGSTSWAGPSGSPASSG